MKLRLHPWHMVFLASFTVTILVFWTYFYTSFSQDRTHKHSLEYDTVWSAANGRNEFSRFAASAARYHLTGAQRDLEEAEINYEILLGRLNTWGSGGFKSLIANSDGLNREFEALKGAVASLAPIAETLKQGDSDAFEQTMRGIRDKVDVIAGRSYQTSVERFSAERRTIRDQLITEKRFVFALLVLATALMAVIMRQNWGLRHANDRIAGDAERLSYVAKHDALTDIANRCLVEDRLREATDTLADSEVLVAIALDLDGFKTINDTLGHSGGDALLIALSKRLVAFTQSLAGHNLAARVGGDEFLILLRCAKVDLALEDTIVALTELFANSIETRIGSFLVGTSIGYATAHTRDEIGNVVLNADLALTQAKAAGRGSAIAFSGPMRTQMERRLRIERDLPAALECGDIEPHYQLQYNMITGQPVGLEALARWHHFELGPISPVEFIPIAEASGDILALGRLMLKSACRDAALLPSDISVAVNFSMIQFLNDDMIDLVKSVLEESGLAPHRLKLEVTESIIMRNVKTVSEILSQLQALGVRISLDDFGTGYSALSYLCTLSWDEIKIDRSFVRACEESAKAVNIIGVMQSMANKMQAELVVEGLETPEQVLLFKKLGCLYGQGFHFNRPSPFQDLSETLEAANSNKTGTAPEPEPALS